MRIVLDTNVLVSGLLTPFGTCGDIVRMLTSGAIILCVDARILLEYDDVLHRPKFDIDPLTVDVVMEYIENSSEVYAPVPLVTTLPDEVSPIIVCPRRHAVTPRCSFSSKVDRWISFVFG